MPKAGIVTVVGKPNAGKSTLLNRIIGEKLSIVSEKPQSTRSRRRHPHHRRRPDDHPRHPGSSTRATSSSAPCAAPPSAPSRTPTSSSTSPTPPNAPRHPSSWPPSSIAPHRPGLDGAQQGRRHPPGRTRGAARGLPRRALRLGPHRRRRGPAPRRPRRRLPTSPFLYPEDEISTASVRFFVAELVRETASSSWTRRYPTAWPAKSRSSRDAVAGIHSDRALR